MVEKGSPDNKFRKNSWQNTNKLQHDALWLSTLSLVDRKRGSGSMLENLLDSLARSCRAFQVLVSSNLLCDSHCLNRLLNTRERTSSVETGACRVFFSSSIVFASFLKSHFNPTRMIGSPAQKWSTSLIHYIWVLIARFRMPFLGHYRGNRGNQWQNRWE